MAALDDLLLADQDFSFAFSIAVSTHAYAAPATKPRLDPSA
jgi:hypothetical protein